MDNLPELIAFSQYKLGGVQNFYYNILANAPKELFDVCWIFEETADNDPKLPQLYGIGKEIIFKLEAHRGQTTYEMADRLQQLISNRPGVILANFWHDLVTLHLHRRPEKTVFFICHDEGYVPLALQFEFLIDVFIAHNEQFFEEMRQVLPERIKDIHFIPHGVKIPPVVVRQNPDTSLKIVIAARMQELKGVYDIPLIDDFLKKKGVKVEWTLIGSGPEKENLQSILLPRGNTRFYAPERNEDVLALMQQQDVFILPSRLDGLPVSLLEAMSTGCVPVISEFNQGIKKVVTDDIGFVLPVGDIHAFGEAISALHQNREDLKNRSQRARTTVINNYNIDIQAKKYFDLFKKYKEFKKPKRNKFHRYGGILDYPFWPPFLRTNLRLLKNTLMGKQAKIQ